MWRLLLLLVPLAGLAYVLWHVWGLLPLPSPWRWAVVGVGLLAFLCLFPAMTRGIDSLPMPLATALYGVGTSSLVVLLYAFLAFLLLDLVRLTGLLPPSALRDNWWTLLGIALLIGGLLVGGNLRYRHKTVVRLALTTPLPLERELRIVMASDLHLGYHIRRGELRTWVDMINSERPDVVLLAGDVVDRSARPLLADAMAEELQRIEAPVYACLGNHEYYLGVPQAAAFLQQAGVTLLRDSVVDIGDLLLVGRDDRTNPRRLSLHQLLMEAPHRGGDSRGVVSDEAPGGGAGRYVIVLDHQPLGLEEAAEEGVDFQLSGHTHHGQVFPASLLTDAIYTVSHGSYALGRTRYYVSSGLGIWGCKARIGTRSELIVATLSPL